VREKYRVTERHACRLLGQWRGTQRYIPTERDDEDALTRAVIELASQYGRYGYRRITIKLQEAGWCVGRDRVEKIWRREGLKVPQKQRPRGRLWLNDGLVQFRAHLDLQGSHIGGHIVYFCNV
jgi:hypothetical protein